MPSDAIGRSVSISCGAIQIWRCRSAHRARLFPLRETSRRPEVQQAPVFTASRSGPSGVPVFEEGARKCDLWLRQIQVRTFVYRR